MKFFAVNFNGVMDDLIPKLDITSVEEADKILVWQDIQGYFKELSDITKYLGKKMILLTHCYGSCNDYLPPHNHTSYADKILVWGQADYDLAKKAGLADKTVITGTQIFSHIKPRQKQKETTIVFCPTHDSRFEIANFDIADKLQGYNVFTKILGDNKEKRYSNPVFSNRTTKEHIDICFDLISKADVVVVNDPTTTFALFAFAAQVPVIFVDNIDTDYHLVSDILLSGEYKTTLDNLTDTIKEVLANDTKKEIRNIIAEYCGVFIKNPLLNILKEIS